VAFGLVVCGAYAGPQLAKGGQSLMMIGDGIVMQNASCRYEIDADGKSRAFVDLATKKDYCEAGQPFMVVGRAKQTWTSTKVARSGNIVSVSFGDSGVQVKAKLESRPSYLTLTVEQVAGGEIDWLQLLNLKLKITDSVGTLLNAGWNNDFAVCALACNDRTDSFGADGAQAHLCAKSYKAFGFEGAKVAVVGVPRDKLMETIEQVEVDQGLPHAILNGVWIRKAPERFASYLMVHNLGEHNVDKVIEVAKGGFGCVEFYPWRSTPSYQLNPSLFPNGMAGLKKVADKIHAAGLQVGLHVMQGMVGWGPKDDPYITPKADPRLLQDRHASLAVPLDEKAIEVVVKETTLDWPETGDLYVEGEIIRYSRRTEAGFAECQRGLHGTTISAHAAGARVGHLVNCFPNWGNTVYCPDVNSTMIDEICDRLATVFNETSADMSYFDGGEELIRQPPYWRNQGRFALGLAQRLKKPIILEGNALYTHLAWHVISRGSPHFDPIYFGRRDYTLRFKGQHPADHAKNLLGGDVGWFNPHVHSPVVDAVTPDEVLLLCLKALGHKSPISFSMDMSNPWANQRMPEMLETIRACDELKRRDYFTDAACAELTKPFAEHTLEQTSDGTWNLRPMQFGPARTVDAERGERSEWKCGNPYHEQRPWVRMRARTRLAPYGAKENLILADPQDGTPLKVVGSASPQLAPSFAASAEKTPEGDSCFVYGAENKGNTSSGWCQVSRSLPQPLDLRSHRRLGLWIRSEGKGGILNVQLAGKDARMDHYIDLDFVGWRYFVLDPPEDSRVWGYQWPYSWTDLMYTSWFIYSATKEVNLFYNALPPNSTTACLIGRIEALHEEPLLLRNPSLEVAARKVIFPVSLKPDEYLEWDWSGRCRHFEPNGGLLGEVQPQGTWQLSAGENSVRFSCKGGDGFSSRAEVTLSVRGEPLPNSRRNSGAKAGQKAGIYPSFSTQSQVSLPMQLLPGSKGGVRLMQGVYERVDSLPSRSVAAFDGKANAWAVDNDRPVACPVFVILSRGIASSTPTVDYDDPDALLLEDFSDLSSYEMSERNQYEKYVVGEGKQLTKDGPVRAGVSQTFASTTEGARSGKTCAVYAATNEGGLGGWCGKGRRFEKPIDLSQHKAVAFWLHGDARGETLRFQFRDTKGRHAHWLVPIDFTGWRLQVCRLADARDFDWKQTEYLLVYFNDLPVGPTCTMKFDDVKAFPKIVSSVPLHNPSISINGKRVTIPVTLDADASLLIDNLKRASLWLTGKQQGKTLQLQGEPLRLEPGANRIEVTCENRQNAPRDVSVRVVRL